jgi:signal transduction histidine kinase
MKHKSEPDELANGRREFQLLVLYRWLSLIPPVLALTLGGSGALPQAAYVLLVAALLNLLITLLAVQLNAMLHLWPWLLAVDLAFCAVLAGLTGGWDTPYYLYTLSPLLAAAFFFQLRGAMLSAMGMAALFIGAGLGTAAPDSNSLRLAIQVVGFFLIAGVMGYAATLTARLQASHRELNRVHRDLEVIHSLTLSLQSASDINEVEERVLSAVTSDLGFSQAVITLVDQNENAITSWLGKAREGRRLFADGLPHPAQVPLLPAAGLIAQSLADGQVRLSARDVFTADEQINHYLGSKAYHIFPMVLREHPVGVLLVEAEEREAAVRLQSLQAIASQAAVAVGTTMLCIDRAQRLAIQDERIRIAREIHDTVSQSLFGITFSLDACVKLLPGQPDTVKTELANLQTLAQATRDDLRQSILDIWPSELTAERFAADLRRYVAGACRAGGLEVAIEVRGDFNLLNTRARRGLYRIAQEALNNVVRHAGASQAQVCLDILNGQAMLAVRDNGRGFDPHVAMAREINREHFGLRGIRDRAASLGGTTEIVSQPGAGATVLVSLSTDSR